MTGLAQNRSLLEMGKQFILGPNENKEIIDLTASGFTLVPTNSTVSRSGSCSTV
jgi:2-keto-3-deoxy-6-phosphogluconate aldolase